MFKTVSESNPKIEQFWLSYIDALKKGQQVGLSIQVIEQAKSQGVTEEKLNSLKIQLVPKTENANRETPSQQQSNSLLEYYQVGRYDDSEKLALSITE